MKDLVVPYNGEPRASSKLIAEGFGVEHRSVVALLNKYSSDFSEFGKMPSEKARSRKIRNDISNAVTNAATGRKELIYYLNEEQTSFLGTLMKNSEKSVQFKKRLIKDYYRIRKILAKTTEQRTDAEWIESRKEGKTARLEETVWIQKFVDYAKGQGSQSPNKYFMNLTKMTNTLLFVVSGKYPNLRDVMTKKQLLIVSVGDNIVEKAIMEGMEKKMFYKDIFQIAKANVMQFAAVYGKSEIVSGMLD
jgi:phage regulator Rha-like protein